MTAIESGSSTLRTRYKTFLMILVFMVPVGKYSNVYISTKPSDSQQYMFIIIYRLKTEQQVSAAFGHHQAQIQKLVLANTVHE
jgi:hypothetical protein